MDFNYESWNVIENCVYGGKSPRLKKQTTTTCKNKTQQQQQQKKKAERRAVEEADFHSLEINAVQFDTIRCQHFVMENLKGL